MRPSFRAAVAALALLCGCEARPAHYRVAQTIRAGDGGFDYLTVDSGRRRLFVAREQGVMAVDLASGRVTERLVRGRDDSAVLLLPGGSLALSTNWGADTATLFDRDTGRMEAVIPTGREPDAAVHDPASGLALVMDGAGRDITLIDPRTARRVGAVPLGDKPEGAAVDAAGRVFVNLQESAKLAVVDIAARRVVARHRLKGCVAPTGLAYDALGRRLVVACRNGVARLVSAADGRDLGGVAIGRDADGVMLDPRRGLAFFPSRLGVLNVVRLTPRGLQPAQTLRTRPGARTGAIDLGTGRLYLASAEERPGPDGEGVQVPGSFRVLVVEPGRW